VPAQRTPERVRRLVGNVHLHLRWFGSRLNWWNRSNEAHLASWTFARVTVRSGGTSPQQAHPRSRSPTPLKGFSAVDTISLKRVDDHTITATGTKSGKVVFSDTRVVAADGATMSIHRNGTTPEGKKYSSQIVLIRVR